MGRLFDGVAEVDRIIASRGLDAVRTKGQIGMKAGFFLAIVFPETPDDPAKIDKLKAAAQDVLGVSLGI